ncbi:hypothetical protein P43SY_001851 [Pythium insidiosum]|uniref:ZZ-type domain-containing protein n=1 Tax=Pythium insidiosum TaxID=114742 RepID=A0AAD5LW36_PYTIN|nr:hypothetical protein P43SY_001851 [Pythium insidiosum]
MQQRMADVESAVATWKEKYLEQLHLARALQAADGGVASRCSGEELAMSRDAAQWLPLARPTAASTSPPSGDLLASVIEQLSPADREKLQTLLATARPEVSATTAPAPAPVAWEEVFEEAPSELLQLLHCYLLPTLESAAQAEDSPRRTFRCLTRTYSRPVTDVLVVCDVAESPDAAAMAVASSPTECSLDSEALGSPISSASLSELNETRTSTDTNAVEKESKQPPPPQQQQQQQQHLFDCVEGRGAPAVPHGPREIHPTKAVYISSATASSAGRRQSMAPSSSASRHPSTASARGGDTPYDDGSDRRSGGTSGSLTGTAPSSSREGSGKIKKMLGMMKGLNRQKTSTLSTSTSTSIVGGASTPTPPALLPSPVPAHAAPEADEHSTCDGCGRNISTGSKWICRTCRVTHGQRYALCDKCYGQGLHGKENELALFERIEEIVVAKCPKLVHEQELMRLLRVGICKGNLKKYSFCLTWIGDLLLCKHIKDLRARALEISQISPHVRSEFVRLLTDLLSKHRRDIELLTEWQPAQNVPASDAAQTNRGSGAGGGELVGSGLLQLDTLRIWVKDNSAAASGD